MPSPGKGARKPSIWMIPASWGYITWQLGQGLDGKHLICIFMICKDRPDAYYGEALESNNLVTLVSLVGQKRRKWKRSVMKERIEAEYKVKEILAAKHSVRPGDRWGLGCYSTLSPSGFSRRVKAEAYGARCEDDAASELVMLAHSAILCVHDTISVFDCPPLQQLDKLAYGAKNFADASDSFGASKLQGKHGVAYRQRMHTWKQIAEVTFNIKE